MIAREWRMANGEYIKIEDMDDNHLDSSIEMLERNDFCVVKTVSNPLSGLYDYAVDSLGGEGHIIYALMCIEKLSRQNIKLAKGGASNDSCKRRQDENSIDCSENI